MSSVGGGNTGQVRTTTLRIDLFSEMDETGHFLKHDIQSDNGETLALLREAFTATRGTGVLNRNNSEHVMILELAKGA